MSGSLSSESQSILAEDLPTRRHLLRMDKDCAALTNTWGGKLHSNHGNGNAFTLQVKLTRFIPLKYNCILGVGGELDSTEVIETKVACRGSTHLVKKVDQSNCRITATCCLEIRYAVSLEFSCGS